MSRHPGTGWVTFAGVILILSGLLNLVDGLWALDVSDEAVSGAEELLWHSSSIETWGWIYTIAGAVLVLVGIGVLTRNPLARWVGVGAASVSMIINMMWVFVFPIAALIHVTLAALVIYGLTAYRDDVG
ncbi:MAG TPA: hypothetical protein VF743_04665 [Acidimicrobiales bacterium]